VFSRTAGGHFLYVCIDAGLDEGGYQATVIFPDGVSVSSEETYPTIA
jgi:hypothetical protein